MCIRDSSLTCWRTTRTSRTFGTTGSRTEADNSICLLYTSLGMSGHVITLLRSCSIARRRDGPPILRRGYRETLFAGGAPPRGTSPRRTWCAPRWCAACKKRFPISASQNRRSITTPCLSLIHISIHNYSKSHGGLLNGRLPGAG